MLQSDQYEEQWHCESDGNQEYTTLRRRNLIMDSFRKSGLHFPEEKAPSSNTQKGVNMASLGDTVMALTGYQVADSQSYQACSTRGYPEFNDDGNSVSSGSMSLDLGEMGAILLP